MPLSVHELVLAARACMGTPFQHQGRVPHVGLDCIGLVVVALQAVGMTVQDRQDYARWPEGQALQQALLSHGAQAIRQPEAGAVLLFTIGGVAQHVALCVTPARMIHAYAPAGGVVETELNTVWRRRLTGIYQMVTE